MLLIKSEEEWEEFKKGRAFIGPDYCIPGNDPSSYPCLMAYIIPDLPSYRYDAVFVYYEDAIELIRVKDSERIQKELDEYKTQYDPTQGNIPVKYGSVNAIHWIE